MELKYFVPSLSNVEYVMILKRAGKFKLLFDFRRGSAIFAGKVMILLSSGMKISGTDADTKNEKGLARFARSAWITKDYEYR